MSSIAGLEGAPGTDARVSLAECSQNRWKPSGSTGSTACAPTVAGRSRHRQRRKSHFAFPCLLRRVRGEGRSVVEPKALTVNELPPPRRLSHGVKQSQWHDLGLLS